MSNEVKNNLIDKDSTSKNADSSTTGAKSTSSSSKDLEKTVRRKYSLSVRVQKKGEKRSLPNLSKYSFSNSKTKYLYDNRKASSYSNRKASSDYADIGKGGSLPNQDNKKSFDGGVARADESTIHVSRVIKVVFYSEEVFTSKELFCDHRICVKTKRKVKGRKPKICFSNLIFCEDQDKTKEFFTKLLNDELIIDTFGEEVEIKSNEFNKRLKEIFNLYGCKKYVNQYLKFKVKDAKDRKEAFRLFAFNTVDKDTEETLYVVFLLDLNHCVINIRHLIPKTARKLEKCNIPMEDLLTDEMKKNIKENFILKRSGDK
ncbi:hypothetical protein CKF54_07365 [Psittacicella hinzii]|uniref:Uncharacterized protein n=1 Tax=Psittacicella hinzii TaxID=2028575 RepID=A0A3A1Y1J8_9GAMM|nr:hypothetical protein [Psittacicella hinzii]RIY31156.1 hypothetical protein CKF54_07365 [Psittacicella hinzii]